MARRAELESIQKAEAEEKSRKFKESIEAEAASINIDSQFKDDISKIATLKGNDKNNACASALKSLLFRNGINKIETEFWSVFRILKSRAEKQTPGI